MLQQQHKSLAEYTGQYTEAFFEDMKRLRIERAETVARATDHITEMAGMISQLGASGYTYESEGSIYFRIAKFPDYGKLSHRDFSGERSGARVDVDTYDKDDARDFALWKAPKGEEPAWDSPVGRGRPGWHIECSAMAIHFLGNTLDIHAGGVDLIFPHHENEIAQSEACTSQPFARHWVHSEFLLVDGQKMSKSLGNFYTLRDILERGHSAESLRYLLASVPYRKGLNFTFDGLKSAAAAIERVRAFQFRVTQSKFPEGRNPALIEQAEAAAQQFRAAMDDDLNTAEALAATFEFIRLGNTAIDSDEFRQENIEPVHRLLALFDSVFEVLLPDVSSEGLDAAEIEALIAERTHAKKARNFKRADEVREQLLTSGIVLEDTKDGVRWKRK